MTGYERDILAHTDNITEKREMLHCCRRQAGV